MTDIYLISCVAAKLDRASPARNLYQSPWFKKARAFVERHSGDWYILSAKHGLPPPAAVIEPYEQTLNRVGGRHAPRVAPSGSRSKSMSK
ncbi:DUF6884 domain-containing protein [Burkholderia gladioli]|uniref:DUF6884 domain-containing protein n=1 Tax=Burkholderia gladioli TaxID=28095 RepID=UPI003D201B5E